jgi:hypothetical protein
LAASKRVDEAVAALPEPTVSSPARADAESVNVDETSAILPLSVPLPPRRPKEASAPPRTKPLRVVERRRTADVDDKVVAETRVSDEPLDLQPAAPQRDERVRVLGLPLPSFVPNGQKIKDCVFKLRC